MNSKNLPPAFYTWMLKKVSNQYSQGPALGDLEEFYGNIVEKSGRRTAVRWYRNQVIKSMPFLLKSMFTWSSSLFVNNLKTAVRSIRKQKGYALINIAGLAIGIACCLLITRFVLYEKSYDTHHQDLDRIFHVKMKIGYIGSDKNIDSWSSSYRIAEALKEDYPEVSHAIRYDWKSSVVAEYSDKKYLENGVVIADPDIFDILTIPFVSGDKTSALTRPGTAVLTRSFAEKYFGSENPVGKLMTIDNLEYEITGIIENPPSNSYFTYSAIVDMQSHFARWDWLNQVHDWTWFGFITYIKLAPGVDPDAFGTKIKHLAHNYVDDYLKERGYKDHTLTLQPIRELHLNSRDNYRNYLNMFMAIGIAVVLIACINYINLVTARAANRAKDIGIRKFNGATRGQLAGQFLAESLVQAGVAFSGAIGIVAIVLPVFNSISGVNFTLSHFLATDIILFGILLLFSSILIAGAYPAFLLSSYKPASVLRGKPGTGSSKSMMRRGLVFFQFAVSVLLLCSTGTIFLQIQHMKTAELGFSKEQKLVVPIHDGTKFRTYKQVFQSIPGVSTISAGHRTPGRVSWFNSSKLTSQPQGSKKVFNHMFFDEDAVKNYGLQLTAGKTFDGSPGMEKKCLINMTGMRSLGFDNPEDILGKILLGWSGEYEIIGVTEDFHFQGLQRKINPLAILHVPRIFQKLVLTVEMENLSRTMEEVEKKWNELFPGQFYRYRFLDEDFNRLYRTEERLGSIIGIFSLLAVFISCLGLIGLSAYMAEKRRKEIGIRKVIGAGLRNIITLLSKEFVILVGVSNLVALPSSWYIMNLWLQDYAYRTEFDYRLYLFVGILSLFIALLTVSWQSTRAAMSNPVDIIRSD